MNPAFTAYPQVPAVSPDPMPARPATRAMRMRLARTARWRLGPVALGTVAASALGIGAGSAYAYLTGGGTGTGHASVGSPVTVTVNAVSGTADLLPGGTGVVYFKLTNTNPFGSSFSAVSAASVTSSSGDPTNCPHSALSIVPTLPFSISTVTLGAGIGTTANASIPGFVKLSQSAPNACQGVTFTISLTLSGQSS